MKINFDIIENDVRFIEEMIEMMKENLMQRTSPLNFEISSKVY